MPYRVKRAVACALVATFGSLLVGCTSHQDLAAGKPDAEVAVLKSEFYPGPIRVDGEKIKPKTLSDTELRLLPGEHDMLFEYFQQRYNGGSSTTAWNVKYLFEAGHHYKADIPFDLLPTSAKMRITDQTSGAAMTVEH